MRPGLTVEVGVRYEYTLLPLPQQPNAALDAVFGASGGDEYRFRRTGIMSGRGWRWRGRRGEDSWGTVRAGYGVYFGGLPGATVRAALLDTALASSATHVHITPATVTACPQVANQGFGYPCAYVSAPPSAVAQTTSAMMFAREFRLPAVQQAELSVEREVVRGVSVRAGYCDVAGDAVAEDGGCECGAVDGGGAVCVAGWRWARWRAGWADVCGAAVYGAGGAAVWAGDGGESNANATCHALTVEARVRRAVGCGGAGELYVVKGD